MCDECRFIRLYFAQVPGFSISHLFPTKATMLSCAAASAASAASMYIVMSPKQLQDHGFWRQSMVHMSIGVAVLATLVLCLCKTEKQAALQLVKLRQAPQGAGASESTGDNEKIE